MRSYAAAFVTGVFLTVKGSEELQSNSRTVVQQLVSDPVHPGDSVTLQCTVDSETCAGEHSVYWFRHGSGESLPGLIYTHGNRSDECEKSPEAGSPTHGCVYSLPKRNLSRSDAGIYYCAVVICGDILFGNGTQLDIEEYNHGRFKIHSDENSNNLTISEIHVSDSATYYCGKVINYEIIFLTGTFLIIKDSEEQRSYSMTVVQQVVSDPVRPGDSVTLQCTVDSDTCAGEHSVYWFRHGSGESLPGLIYTHGKRSDECEKSPEAGSPTHGCVYSLPKRNLSRSDAGIYYCAVLTCGDILFGNGTQLDIEGKSKLLYFAYRFDSSGACPLT
ncbi:uncharacterized protein LOC108925254 [Scleropages formosus]|uniref:uncharacterized protein LOC108925254 n=1 Tax=Scleropages formosus TaxID=113540 RepID=UPI0010FAA177|nr:uncharacterized protein LOC108925254 [Scleropages formosus]